jgi:hypothetical protein
MWRRTTNPLLFAAGLLTAAGHYRRRAASGGLQRGTMAGLWRGRSDPPRGAAGSTSATTRAGSTGGPLPTSARVAAHSSTSALTEAPLPPARCAEQRAEALAWAEALSCAGEAICEVGFEDEALRCFVVAGCLLERAGLEL